MMSQRTVPVRPEVFEGRMLRFFSEPGTTEAIGRLAAAGHLTLFVGAGASKEVGLPTWAELIERLAERATADVDEEHRGSVQSFLKDAGLLAAAERIECLLTDDTMEEVIREAIYQEDEPASVQPGPLCHAVAELATGRANVHVVTTNYDQLLVKAFRDRGETSASYCTASTQPHAVIHLHGVVGFEAPADGGNDIVLTEHQFLAPAAGGWRNDVVTNALRRGPCLFVGASLTDLNLLTPLHKNVGADAHRHVLLFVRDPALAVPDRLKREEIDKKRWSQLNVDVLFADNFADVAQFVTEVSRAAQCVDSYETVVQRARGAGRLTRPVVRCEGDLLRCPRCRAERSLRQQVEVHVRGPREAARTNQLEGRFRGAQHDQLR